MEGSVERVGLLAGVGPVRVEGAVAPVGSSGMGLVVGREVGTLGEPDLVTGGFYGLWVLSD